MIYEFTVEEISKTVIPIKSDNPDEAQRIFDTWYKDQDNDSGGSVIAELLENGCKSRVFTRSAGIDEDEYLKMNESMRFGDRHYMLPEEKPLPDHNYYSMYVRFADGRKTEHFTEKTIQQLGRLLDSLGDKYCLISDYSHQDPNIQNCFWFYAILKDQEEQWIEIE